MRNLRAQPRVSVRIGDVTEPGRARVVDERGEDARGRELLFGKYAARYGGDLADRRRTALPIAVDFDRHSSATLRAGVKLRHSG